MIFLPYLNLSVINIICKDNSLLVLAQQNHRVGSFFPNTAVTLRINRVIESRINQNHYLLYSFSPFYCSKRMFYLQKNSSIVGTLWCFDYVFKYCLLCSILFKFEFQLRTFDDFDDVKLLQFFALKASPTMLKHIYINCIYLQICCK